MGRLIELQQAQDSPTSLKLRVGDLLIIKATGIHIESGADILETLGPFVPGLMLENGNIVSPVGAPNTVLLLTHRSGLARIKMIIGDPWHRSDSRMLEITVED
jgi:hypothetical protein